MQPIRDWIGRMTGRYGWSPEHSSKILLFLCTCSRILGRELRPQLARQNIASACEWRGAFISQFDIDSILGHLRAISKDQSILEQCSREISIMGCEAPADIRRKIGRLLARVGPMRCDASKVVIAEYSANIRAKLPPSVWRAIDEEDARAIEYHLTPETATIRDMIRADIYIYNTIGMSEHIVGLLIDEFERIIARNAGTFVILIAREDIMACHRAQWTSEASRGKKLAIMCQSERKMCAILDVITP